MVVYNATSAQLNISVSETAGVAALTLSGPSTVVEDTSNAYGGKLIGLGGAGIDGAWIDLSYQMAGGAWTFLVTAITSGGGNYSAQLIFPNKGNYILRAFWSGGIG